jgi:hypothetical protein
MNINASGRGALILATGLFTCFAAPSPAPASTDGSKSLRHHRHYVHHRSGKVAVKSSDSKKEAATDTAENAGINPATLPPSVANANAQLATAADALADSARAMTARANDIVQAAADSRPATGSQMVAPDQINDVDRALREDPQPQQTTLAMSLADAAAASAPQVMASSESSSWDQSSLIGEICIVSGALLTLASAARMFTA